MRNHFVLGTLVAVALQLVVVPSPCAAQPQAVQTRYPAAAPLDQYFVADRDSEIVLARSAAPKSISDGADVMVLGRHGYEIAVKGTNGFLCLVERSWGAATDDPEFWNPRVRSPICFNPAARKTVVAIYLMKTRLVLAGKSKAEIGQAVRSALETKHVPALAPGAMCYMMSRQQYLNDRNVHWHPHLMFFVPGDAARSWGANRESSPVIAVNDPEERMTIMMVWAGHWSDGTMAPMMDN